MRPPNSPLPTATGYQGAFRALVDWRWLKSTEHRDLVRFTDLTQTHEPVKELIKKLLSRARKSGIPLMCEESHGDVAFICHSRRRRSLTPLEWEIIGHMGTEISRSYRLGVRWGGPMLPRTWLGDGRVNLKDKRPSS